MVLKKIGNFFSGLVGNKKTNTSTNTSTTNTSTNTSKRVNTSSTVPTGVNRPKVPRNAPPVRQPLYVRPKIPRNAHVVNNKSRNARVVRPRVPLNARVVRPKVPLNARVVRPKVPLNARRLPVRPPVRSYYGGKKKHRVMTKRTRKVDGVTRVVRRTKTGRRYVLLHGRRRYL